MILLLISMILLRINDAVRVGSFIEVMVSRQGISCKYRIDLADNVIATWRNRNAKLIGEKGLYGVSICKTSWVNSRQDRIIL